MAAQSISDEKKLAIIELLEQGVRYRFICKKLHVNPETITAVKREYYEYRTLEEEIDMDTVIAGNKNDGLLTAVGQDKYLGTCRLPNGRMERNMFFVHGSKDAVIAWEKWKDRVMAKANKAPQKTHEDSPIIEAPAPTTSEDGPIYILVAGDAKIAGYSRNFEEIMKAEDIANKALELVGVDIRYSAVECKPYRQ